MLKLFKKKESVYIDLETYDYSSFARDMTEEELLTVNGGKWIGNSDASVAEGEVGDTLRRKDGTVVTITQADIDWAKEQVGSPSTSTTTTTETSSSSTTSSESNNDRPREQNNASSTGGSRVNMGAGSMTVSDYIAQQKKKGAGATPAGQAVEVRKNEGQAAEGNLTERGYPSSRDPNPGKYNPKKEEALPVNKTVPADGNLTDRGYPSSRDANPGKHYEGNLTERGFSGTTEGYPDAYKTSEKTGAERIKEAIKTVGKKEYIYGVYQCDQYANEVVETAGFNPSDYFLDDPTGKLVDEHIKDLEGSGKLYSKTADWLLPGAYVVFMSDDDKEKESHAALLVVENGTAYIQDNSSRNNSYLDEEGNVHYRGGTEKTDGSSASDVCSLFKGYDNFYFQRLY